MKVEFPIERRVVKFGSGGTDGGPQFNWRTNNGGAHRDGSGFGGFNNAWWDGAFRSFHSAVNGFTTFMNHPFSEPGIRSFTFGMENATVTQFQVPKVTGFDPVTGMERISFGAGTIQQQRTIGGGAVAANLRDHEHFEMRTPGIQVVMLRHGVPMGAKASNE